MDYMLDIVLNFKKNVLLPETRFCIETTEAHRRILTLLRSNQPGKAKVAMIDHLREVETYLGGVEVDKNARFREPGEPGAPRAGHAFTAGRELNPSR